MSGLIKNVVALLFAILGPIAAAISLMSTLDYLERFTPLANNIINTWNEWTFFVWKTVLGWVGIDLSPGGQIMLTVIASLIICSIGARIIPEKLMSNRISSYDPLLALLPMSCIWAILCQPWKGASTVTSDSAPWLAAALTFVIWTGSFLITAIICFMIAPNNRLATLMWSILFLLLILLFIGILPSFIQFLPK